MQYGITADNNVAGTGPFVATKVSDKQIELVKILITGTAM